MTRYPSSFAGMIALGLSLALGDMENLFGQALTQEPAAFAERFVFVSFTIGIPHFLYAKF
jgi:hypothetical protein